MTVPADPISPELVLVAPPEEAELARRSLPLPVPPIPRFPTFPPAPVRARAERAERSWTYGIAAVVVLAFAIATAVVLNRSGDGPAATARRVATTPTPTHPAPTKPASRPTTTAQATTPARTTQTTSAPTKTTQTTSTPTKTTSTPAKTTSTPTKTTKSPPKGFVPSRVFAWPVKEGAVAYMIRFFRGNKLVFQRRTVEPRITLPGSFEFARGTYRWLVVPVDRRGNEGTAVVASHFTVGG